MWGNRLGWGISTALVVLMVLALWAIHGLDQISPPTALGRNSQNLAKLALPVAPDKVVTVMTDNTDAGDAYRKAIDDYNAHPIAYTRSKYELSDLQNLKGVECLLQGASAKRMTLFTKKPAEVITYKNKESITALRGIAGLTMQCGLRLKANDPAAARKHYEAVFSLGAKLFDERVVYEELEAGMGLMADAASALVSLEKTANNTERVQELNDFLAGYRDYDREHIKPIIGALKTIDNRKIAQYAGDVFVFAQTAQEKLWRVEAILQLGRYRYNANRPGDQRGAMRLLRQLANDPDPIIRTAAIAGRDMSIEDYHLQGG